MRAQEDPKISRASTIPLTDVSRSARRWTACLICSRTCGRGQSGKRREGQGHRTAKEEAQRQHTAEPRQPDQALAKGVPRAYSKGLLKRDCWMGIRHGRGEQWPVVKEWQGQIACKHTALHCA